MGPRHREGECNNLKLPAAERMNLSRARGGVGAGTLTLARDPQNPERAGSRPDPSTSLTPGAARGAERLPAAKG